MGCTGCKNRISGVCKACELLDDDTSIKDVHWCPACGVYICTSCDKDYTRRIPAFFLMLKDKVSI